MQQTLEQLRLEQLRNELNTVTEELCAAKNQLYAAHQELERLRFSAKSSARPKAEFVGTMCHDYRGPLAAMLGFSNFLVSEDITPTLTQKQREYARYIRTGLQHLLALTNNIFDTIAHEIGKPWELKEHIIDLDHFIEDTLHLVPGVAEVALRWLPGPLPLPRLYCDPVRARQVLLNVVGNAVKYTSQSDGLVEITVEVSDGFTFVVADNGIGIKPEDVPRVLTPFERVNGNAPGMERGLGLGLPLAKALMEAHGGTLVLHSTPGHGTTVRLWFPSERVHLGSAHALVTPHGRTGKGRILIVEDRKEMATYLKDVAEAHGYETFMARLGRAALDLAREKRPNLILMDVGLPDISGLEAVYWLKKDARTADIPIIGITAMGIPERWILAGGCDAFFSKGDKDFLEDLLRCAEQMVKSGPSTVNPITMKEQTLDIDRTVSECVEWIHIAKLTRSHGVTVSWQQDRCSLPNLFCDPAGLRKILWETIAYTMLEINHGGQIQIKTDLSKGYSIIIEYNRWSDNPGIGFAPVKALVERYGGDLSRQGSPETGTTMRVSFPQERVRPETLH